LAITNAISEKVVYSGKFGVVSNTIIHFMFKDVKDVKVVKV